MLLKKLTHFSKHSPDEEECEDFFTEFMLLTLSFEDSENEAGKFALRLGQFEPGDECLPARKS